MKYSHLYSFSAIIVTLCLLAYAFDLSVLPSKVIDIEPATSKSQKTLADNLDSIPDYIAPEVLKTQLSAEQKKQYAKLNETQQKEALSAMGHQQSLKDVSTYGEIELNRLQELDKDIANNDLRAEEIIESLNAKVTLKKAQSEQAVSQ